jgi:hypothetical protein
MMVSKKSAIVGGRVRIRDRQFTPQKRAQEKPLRKGAGQGEAGVFTLTPVNLGTVYLLSILC